jgi:hypothetical protein
VGKLTFKNNKMKNILHIISLVIIATSIVLIIEYPNYQRIQLIAGGLAFLGFVLNISGYTVRDKKQ